ncbi:acetyltransferase GNAT family [Butyrivibrio proteoclasticus B316]|uniref:Acetyltransferase GNAT family n=1 Tax=Butyrivibrio proteoclasticus (strain ATCC 51982 / DSM 14932 / B316) TaxID=515622 RepID=E0S396_BUTPB|nr:GNAT family N-acetyltransferase [Butyrivibrio proteoclasticus]ADL35878.1 acetyltransferase GNAT family [Butyrivibrio proteoclasticus B316]
MKHCGTQTIETERLILRQFKREDADSMFKNWANDEEVTKYLTWPPHGTVDVTKEILKQWVDSYKDEKYYQWAIVLKEIDEPIGSISAVGMEERINMIHIGYCIGKLWWNQGITSEALKAVIEFFFDKVEANRIESRHDVNNPHSGMVMKKCGMKYEGTLRSSDINNQGLNDSSWYAILRSDMAEDDVDRMLKKAAL